MGPRVLKMEGTEPVLTVFSRPVAASYAGLGENYKKTVLPANIAHGRHVVEAASSGPSELVFQSSYEIHSKPSCVCICIHICIRCMMEMMYMHVCLCVRIHKRVYMHVEAEDILRSLYTLSLK